MINFQNGVLDYLDDLVFILFKEEYFGFMQSSYDYVDKIIDFINYNHCCPIKLIGV